MKQTQNIISIVLAGLLGCGALLGQIRNEDAPGSLALPPSYSTWPLQLGNSIVTYCTHGAIVADLDCDSLFLITFGIDVQARAERTGVVCIDAIADYKITPEQKFSREFVTYGLYLAENRVIWMFGYEHFKGNDYVTKILSISNEGESALLNLGVFEIDSISLSHNGVLEAIDYRKEHLLYRATILNDRFDIVKDTTVVRLRAPRRKEYVYPLAKLDVNGVLNPIRSGYFTSSDYWNSPEFIGADLRTGYTWFSHRGCIYGVQSDKLEHLHSYTNIVPMDLSLSIDSTNSTIDPQFPKAGDTADVSVKMIDYFGKMVASKTIHSKSNNKITFSTKRLKEGVYSVIAMQGQRRGVRSVRVR